MICHNCVGEQFLKAGIKRKGKRGQCSYCSKTLRCYSLNQISEKIESAFKRHYVRGDQNPDPFQEAMMRDEESSYDWIPDGEPVELAIQDAADIPEQAARDIQKFLEKKYKTRHHWETGEECEFDSSSYYIYEHFDSDHWQSEWNNFEQSLKTETRFFNTLGMAHLKAVFAGIEKMTTRDNRPAIAIAGPRTAMPGLYRARVFQSNEKLKTALCHPDKELGTPAPVWATAGRMNAAGISVFYGATHPNLAIAEVRPPVGSQVAVARFDFAREVRLLDLTTLGMLATEGSIFDEEYSAHLHRAAFLRDLSARIMKPVLPDDAPFEYLPTQAISDYLAADTVLNLDGIIFSSSQVPGDFVNVVLFSKAAVVEPVSYIEGSEVRASTELWDEDGPFTYYQVVIETSKQIENTVPKLPPDPWGEPLPISESKLPVTLRVDLDSIKVHIVEAVVVTTQEHEVYHHQQQKTDFSDLQPPTGWK